MPQTLSPNEIRDRVLKSVHDWTGATSEVAFLFVLEQHYTSLPPAAEKPKRGKRRAR